MPLQVTTGLPYFLGVVKVESSTTGSIPVNFQCPCGLVKAMVDVNNGTSGMVTFTSVPAFAFATDIKVKTKSYGELTVDVGYGGTFYVLVTDKQLDLVFREVSAEELADKAEEILEVCRKQLTVTHPEENDLAFIYGVIITDGKDNFVEFKDEPTCNMCYFGDGQVRELSNILLTSDNTSWVYIFCEHFDGLICIGRANIWGVSTLLTFCVNSEKGTISQTKIYRLVTICGIMECCHNKSCPSFL